MGASVVRPYTADMRAVWFLAAVPLFVLVACVAPVDEDDADDGKGDGKGDGEGEGDGEGDSDSDGEGDVDRGVVVINEVACSGDDFVEVDNIGAVDVDLRDFFVTDDLRNLGHRAVIDDIDAVIAPGEFGVFVPHGFGIACGENVFLVDGDVVVDNIVAADAGRVPDGTGAVVDVVRTPGAANVARADPTAGLFDPFGPSARIELTLPPTSEESLRNDGYTYVEGTFAVTSVVDGVEATAGPMTVGLRKKGRIGSFRDFDQKMGWKIDFNRFVGGQKLGALGKLNLNNLVQDSSTVHEWMAYELFRREGVPSPRVGFARVFVNGVEFGTYLTIEATDDDAFLDRNFSSTRAIFEGEYGEDLFDGAAGNFDFDGGDPRAEDDLAALVTAVSAAPADDFYGSLDPLIDWDEVLAEMATEVFIGHWDGYAPTRNNYYLHLDHDGVWSLTPWGVDQTFDYD